jgi:hypothetical protein
MTVLHEGEVSSAMAVRSLYTDEGGGDAESRALTNNFIDARSLCFTTGEWMHFSWAGVCQTESPLGSEQYVQSGLAPNLAVHVAKLSAQ